MMRKDNAINRLGQKKAELKILSLQKIPFPDLSHHKKKKEKFSLKARYETQEWRRNCQDLVGMIAELFGGFFNVYNSYPHKRLKHRFKTKIDLS